MTGTFDLEGGQVTIFGASGFIGRHLVQRLARAGAIIRVGVRRPERANYLKPMGNAGQIVPVRADVTDDSQVAAAVESADAVVNLVGILAESGSRTFEEIHHRAAGRVAAAAKKAGAARLVHMSALGADPASPSEYARTKAAGEKAAAEAFPGAAILRPSVVFGPEDNFFNLFAAVARLSPVLPVFGAMPGRRPGGGFDLFGAGGPRFQPVYVGDVAEAIVKILADPDTAGRTYELGGPRVYTFKELMELLLEVTGRRRLLVPVPLPVLFAEATVLEMLRLKLITRDQVRLLARDNVVSGAAPGFESLGIAPAAAEILLPTYLGRFRRPGTTVRRRGGGPPAPS